MAEQKSQQERADEVASVIAEFVEAITHHILHARKVYPREAFERTRLYGVAIQRSRHPGLISYIADTTAAMRPMIASGAVRKVAIVVQSHDRSECIERYLLNIDVPAASVHGSSTTELSSAADVERRLAGCFTKASVVAQQQPPLPEGATFELVAYSSERPGGSDYWVEEGPIGGSRRLEVQEHKALKAIKDCNTSVLNASLVLEQSSSNNR